MQNLENTETEAHILNIGVEAQKIMSLKRFIFLSIGSFGLYPIWWTFEAWRFFMQKDHLDIMPAMRTILAYFFIYSLFNKIQMYAEGQGYTQKFSSISCAWVSLPAHYSSNYLIRTGLFQYSVLFFSFRHFKR